MFKKFIILVFHQKLSLLSEINRMGQKKTLKVVIIQNNVHAPKVLILIGSTVYMLKRGFVKIT